jgi:hypothetical protein
VCLGGRGATSNLSHKARKWCSLAEVDCAAVEAGVHAAAAPIATPCDVVCALTRLLLLLPLQDRWFELSGAEGVQVRLRMALVPGSLAGTTRRSSSSSRRQQQQRQQLLLGSGDDVSHMLSFFHKQLQRSSRDSILVEVRSGVSKGGQTSTGPGGGDCANVVFPGKNVASSAGRQ